LNSAAAGNSGGGGVAGRSALRELLQARLPDPAAVRAGGRAVRDAGPDPDLPPPLFHCLSVVSSLWSFSADDARECSAALAAGDRRRLRRLLERNRKFVARSQRQFARMVRTAFRPVPVPALPSRTPTLFRQPDFAEHRVVLSRSKSELPRQANAAAGGLCSPRANANPCSKSHRHHGFADPASSARR
jgi:hypothetical protein